MLWFLLHATRAEGIDATLRKETVIHVEIRDTTARYIFWSGEGLLSFEAPDGTSGELKDGQGVVTYATGTWVVSPTEDEPPGWDISVTSSGTGGKLFTGLISSEAWQLQADDPLYEQLFVPVPVGQDLTADTSEVRIVSAKVDGLLGETIEITASAEGDGALPGWSVPDSDAIATTQLPLYLDHPNHYETGVVDTAVTMTGLGYSDSCEVVSPGSHKLYTFTESSSYGQLVLGCDLDADGDLDLSGEGDLVMATQLAPGETSLVWEGQDATGAALTSGNYECWLYALLSPVHVQVYGADVADPGVRLLSSSIAGTSLSEQLMYWNDELVDLGIDTNIGRPGLVHSGQGGISSTDAGTSGGLLCTSGNAGDCNSHGWGRDGSVSRGSEGWIDTWAANNTIELANISVEVVGEGDTDGDGLDSSDERCLVGTDPDAPDTDGDALSDGQEVTDVGNPRDTDGDTLIDALDPDDDGDGIDTIDEVAHGDTFGRDVDGDGDNNWLDTDSDDDGIPDGDEPYDANNDDIPDYLQAPAEPPEINWARWQPPETATATGTLSGGALLCGTAPGRRGGLLVLLATLAGALRRRQKVS